MAAQYAGFTTIKIKTLTTSYDPLVSPWSWLPNALNPMEQVVFATDAFKQTLQGVGGAVFDYVNGWTKYSIGEMSGTSTTDVILLWTQGYLAGWFINPSTQLSPYCSKYPFTLGIDATYLNLSGQPLLALPNEPNTAMPNSDAGANWLTPEGIYASYTIDLAPFYTQWNISTNNLTDSTITIPFGSTIGNLDGVIPNDVTGKSYFHATTSTATPSQTGVGITDFESSYSFNAETLANPPGSSLNINSMIADVSPMSTYYGWSWFFNETLTITGKTFTGGFGVLVSPDFSQYQLLEIIGTDTNSANWFGGSGATQGKWDQYGALFLKNVDNANTIWVQDYPTNQLVQTFPPIDLPSPPNDMEVALLSYRETNDDGSTNN